RRNDGAPAATRNISIASVDQKVAVDLGDQRHATNHASTGSADPSPAASHAIDRVDAGQRAGEAPILAAGSHSAAPAAAPS
ncbi:MAG: hypothetical protein IPJ62_09515, partial [Betaproteobacteria bacterium]|nr:hypothetical protein [Betaproteobacteria bacterium]